MNKNRKIALVCFIIAFLSAVCLLKCDDTEQAPVKDPKEQRGRMNPDEMDEAARHQRDGIPPAPPQQPPD